MPNDPQTATWLSEEERELALRRLRSERVNSDELVDKFNWTKLRRGIINPVVLPTACIFLLNSVIVQGASFSLPTLVATIFPTQSVTVKQLLTVPPYVLGAISCVVHELRELAHEQERHLPDLLRRHPHHWLRVIHGDPEPKHSLPGNLPALCRRLHIWCPDKLTRGRQCRL